jgi:formiminotetrahydrofolate cyclodeaminase
MSVHRGGSGLPTPCRWSLISAQPTAGGGSVPALSPLQGVSSLITLAARAASVRALAGATTAAVR